MAEPNEQVANPRVRRPRATAVALALVPLLVSAGVMAPGVIAQLAAQSSNEQAEAKSFPEQLSPFEHRPLTLPRRLALGFAFDDLFVETSAPPELAGRLTTRDLAQLLSFPRSQGDSIVLDDLDPHFEEIVFKDALVGEPVVEITRPGIEDEFLPNCGALHASNCPPRHPGRRSVDGGLRAGLSASAR
jgi:hypothetical protein